MSTTTKKLLEDALQLPDRDRADLAARLIESLDTFSFRLFRSGQFVP